MEHRKHRKPNTVIAFARHKPVHLSFLAVLVSGIGILTALHSFANTPLQSDGGISSYAQPGQPPTTPNGGVTGSPATLYPQSSSTDLPSKDTGGFSTADYYIDQKVTVDGPGQNLSSPNAWLLHFDITADSAGTRLQGNNGYEQITSTLITPWIDAVDGYGGSGGATESQFDTFLRGEVEQQKAIWAKSNLFNGGNTITTYDLPTLISDAGGAFSGRYAGIGTTEGPKFFWTYAPQAKVVVPPQTITGKAGEKIYFNNEVAIQTYHSTYHWEYVEVDGPNGTPVVPATAIHLQNTATSSHTVYQTPGDPTSPKMTEVNGGNNDPGSVAPRWHYWVDGTGETGWGTGNVPQNQQDYIRLPRTLAPGQYKIKLWAADYYNRVTASPATATFTVGNGKSTSGITLTVNGGNTAIEPIGTAVNLTATVNTPPPAGHQWQIIIEDNNGSTIGSGRAQASSSFGTQTTFSTTADSQTSLSGEQYTAYLYDETTGTSVPSNAVTASWTNSGGGTGGGGGGICPAPYISGQQWVNDGGGNQTLKWVLNTPTPRYHWVGPAKHRRYVFWYCQDVQTPESKYYPAQVGSGQVTGLSYDPGTPNYLWLPTSVQQWSLGANPGGFWSILNAAHGWSGFEQGGPDASQVTGSFIIRGQKYFSYGSSAQSPWVWARPDSGVGFRVKWVGSPDAIPQSGSVLYTMINPSDGAKRQWSQKLILNGSTLYNQGTQFQNLTPPSDAEEFVSAWSQIPKHVLGASGPELANWSLSSSPQTAFNNGAHISVQVQINTTAGTVTYNVPSMVCLFSYPAWYMNQIHSTTANGQTYVGTTPAKDGP
ncbi:hypothetical protein JZ785_18370 [Alicyclobacillus curvatus]|nr:hypothetical protein JZ785_18370 [Alicyclobacillus curvatus]